MDVLGAKMDVLGTSADDFTRDIPDESCSALCHGHVRGGVRVIGSYRAVDTSVPYIAVELILFNYIKISKLDQISTELSLVPRGTAVSYY